MRWRGFADACGLVACVSRHSATRLPQISGNSHVIDQIGVGRCLSACSLPIFPSQSNTAVPLPHPCIVGPCGWHGTASVAVRHPQCDGGAADTRIPTPCRTCSTWRSRCGRAVPFPGNSTLLHQRQCRPLVERRRSRPDPFQGMRGVRRAHACAHLRLSAPLRVAWCPPTAPEAGRPAARSVRRCRCRSGRSPRCRRYAR